MKLVVSKSVLFWYWKLQSRNGKTICSSWGQYKTKSQAKRAAENFNGSLHKLVPVEVVEEGE